MGVTNSQIMLIIMTIALSSRGVIAMFGEKYRRVEELAHANFRQQACRMWPRAKLVPSPKIEGLLAGAIAMFGEKYSDAAVRVVEVPGASMELCGGTHVERTAQVGSLPLHLIERAQLLSSL